MDFSLPPDIVDYQSRIRAFVNTHLIPLESDRSAYDAHENIGDEALGRLRAQAKREGLWSLQMPRERGGQGLSFVGMAACYEEMNRSLFGPVVFNSSAPDDGNMIVLNKVGTPAQKERWLQPIIDGDARSSIVMTEPAPGAGSDPTMMRTTATKKGDRWIINGHKWFITGADAAKHFLLLAKTSDDPRKGLTAFMFDRDQPGWELVRRIPIMGPEEHGGHCEMRFEGLEIPDDARLLEVGDGLKVAQIRLGPARLTHCMRWLGLARKSMEVALDYVKQRDVTHGKRLSDSEGVQGMLGEVAMRIQIGRLLTMHAAWQLDQGSFARKEVSMAKVVVADVLHQSVDTALQLNGARGYSKDTPLEWIYRYARQARIVDGASEVHKTVLAKLLLGEGAGFWSWDPAAH